MTTIRPDTRIGDLLSAHPHLLETLANYAPAFAKLRNPLLRRTIGRMATLAQVAGIGGVDLAELLRTLREAIGEPVSAGEGPALSVEQLPLSAATGEPPAWLDESRIAARLDARPLHADGQNPIAPILKASQTVPEGGVFCLRNTFEPLPLYEVLGRQGFTPWARQYGPDDWEVFFYRARAGEEVTAPGEATLEPGAPSVASVTVDVSQLTPPEPMVRVLEALAQLQAGETLLVRHVQRPMYLYGKLDEMGHTHQTWDMGPGHVEILIRVGEGK
jgi:uncharacterized protein (DUF2249 family)